MGFTPELMVTHRVVVGISDLAVANSANIMLSTYALGSCIGVVGFDAHCGAAGLIHIMLPKVGSRASGNYAKCMFADTGLPELVKGLSGVRALRARMVFALIGGASVTTTGGAKSFFRIGEENIEEARSYFSREGLKVVYEDIGGCQNRTVHFLIGKGLLTIKKPTGTDEIDLR